MTTRHIRASCQRRTRRCPLDRRHRDTTATPAAGARGADAAARQGVTRAARLRAACIERQHRPCPTTTTEAVGRCRRRWCGSCGDAGDDVRPRSAGGGGCGGIRA